MLKSYYGQLDKLTSKLGLERRVGKVGNFETERIIFYGERVIRGKEE